MSNVAEGEKTHKKLFLCVHSSGARSCYKLVIRYDKSASAQRLLATCSLLLCHSGEKSDKSVLQLLPVGSLSFHCLTRERSRAVCFANEAGDSILHLE